MNMDRDVSNVWQFFLEVVVFVFRLEASLVT